MRATPEPHSLLSILASYINISEKATGRFWTSTVGVAKSGLEKANGCGGVFCCPHGALALA